jgi:hypothetical protein
VGQQRFGAEAACVGRMLFEERAELGVVGLAVET